MTENYGKILYRDHEYIMPFNFNIMEAIQEKYGSLAEWGKLTDGSDGEPNISAIIYAYWLILNEGIEISNEDLGTDLKPMSIKQVGRVITEVGLAEATAKLNKTVIESTKDAEQKNA